jgi:transposase InsO family protein
MIDPGHPRLSIVRQCELASISRSSFYREPTAESEETLRLMRLIDEQFLETPWYGSRQMARHLRRQGWCVGRHRVRRLMTEIGLAPIYQHPKTSEPHPQHKVYPYLLRHLTIDRPNQVWCADVTYIQMRRGFLYLVAIMDWASRKGPCLAVIEHDGRRVLRCCAGGGHRSLWQARDLQHRPGLAVHQLRVHQHAARRRHPNLDGWSGTLDG